MIDKAKVMLGLQIHALSTKCEDDGHYCPYFASDECSLLLCKDTLELLKEQKAEIESLEHNLAVTQDNLNWYLNGNA